MIDCYCWLTGKRGACGLWFSVQFRSFSIVILSYDELQRPMDPCHKNNKKAIKRNATRTDKRKAVPRYKEPRRYLPRLCRISRLLRQTGLRTKRPAGGAA